MVFFGSRHFRDGRNWGFSCLLDCDSYHVLGKKKTFKKFFNRVMSDARIRISRLITIVNVMQQNIPFSGQPT